MLPSTANELKRKILSRFGANGWSPDSAPGIEPSRPRVRSSSSRSPVRQLGNRVGIGTDRRGEGGWRRGSGQGRCGCRSHLEYGIPGIGRLRRPYALPGHHQVHRAHQSVSDSRLPAAPGTRPGTRRPLVANGRRVFVPGSARRRPAIGWGVGPAGIDRSILCATCCPQIRGSGGCPVHRLGVVGRDNWRNRESRKGFDRAPREPAISPLARAGFAKEPACCEYHGRRCEVAFYPGERGTEA